MPQHNDRGDMAVDRVRVGAQDAHQDFEAIGEEAFVPPAVTKTLSMFAVDDREFGAWTLEGGAPIDSQKTTPDAASGLPEYDDEAVNLLLGTVWSFAPGDALALNLTRTQRHPQAISLDAPTVTRSAAVLQAVPIQCRAKEQAGRATGCSSDLSYCWSCWPSVRWRSFW